MATLSDQVRDLFNRDFINRSASVFGESGPGIQKALDGAVAAVFTRLLQKTDNTAGSTDVYNMTIEVADSGAANNPATLLSGGDLPGISEIATHLFGDKLAATGHALSGFAGIKQSSAVSILTIAGITTLSFLGLYAGQNELSAADLGQLIQSQKEDLPAAIPPGFNLASALGTSTSAPADNKTQDIFSSPAAPGGHTSYHTAKKSTGWIVPTGFLIIVVALIWYLMRSCN